MLARMGDARAIAPLARVFDTGWLWQSKYQADVEAALTRLLTGAAGWPEARPYEADVRQLAERVWGSGRQLATDLTPAHAALLMAALPYLHAGGAASAALVDAIAAAPVKGARRTEVREAARQLRGGA
jgi:hypothetical protein